MKGDLGADMAVRRANDRDGHTVTGHVTAEHGRRLADSGDGRRAANINSFLHTKNSYNTHNYQLTPVVVTCRRM